MTETENRVAIIVDPTLPSGLLANTVAVIGVGLGAAAPWLGGQALTDAARRTMRASANRPVPVLQASADVIGGLLIRALPAPPDAFVVPFPAYARPLHGFDAYCAEFGTRDLARERIEGIGLAGPAKWVRSLTGALALLR